MDQSGTLGRDAGIEAGVWACSKNRGVVATKKDNPIHRKWHFKTDAYTKADKDFLDTVTPQLRCVAGLEKNLFKLFVFMSLHSINCHITLHGCKV